jgi:hypothetical protein
MSSEWAAAIRAADKHIATPKPSWPDRHDKIIKSGFCAKALRASAIKLTAEAIEKANGPAPSIGEARQMEVAANAHVAASETKAAQQVQQEAADGHESLMAKLLANANRS